MKKIASAYRFLVALISPIFILFFFTIAFSSRLLKNVKIVRPLKVTFGTEPLPNYKNWSRALSNVGLQSKTLVAYVSRITNSSDFDSIIIGNLFNKRQKFTNIFFPFICHCKFIWSFIISLAKNDVLIFSCSGFILHNINIGLFNYRIEYLVLRAGGIKIVTIPFGGDAYVYRRISEVSLFGALHSQYPELARKQREISKRLDFWVDSADLFLSGGMILDGIGRCDWVVPNTLCVDFDEFTKMRKERIFSQSNKLIISHAPNHRAVKGTDQIIEAVRKLQENGYEVELILLENMQNEEVKRFLCTQSDIHVDQLFAPTYGLNSIEAMAAGVPVITSLSSDYIEFFTRYSFLSECPIQNANSKNLYEILEKLVSNSEMRKLFGDAGITYVEKYHSYEYFAKKFSNALNSM